MHSFMLLRIAQVESVVAARFLIKSKTHKSRFALDKATVGTTAAVRSESRGVVKIMFRVLVHVNTSLLDNFSSLGTNVEVVVCLFEHFF